MKKFFVFVMGLTLLMGSSFGQSYFEGKIVYNISLEGENAEMMASMMPQQFQYLVKGNQLKFSMVGGMMQDMMGDFLINTDEGSGYMVQHSMKKAYKMDPPTEEDLNNPAMTPNIEKQGEKATIAGYSCEKYLVTMNSDAGAIQQEIWATDAIKLKRPKLPAAGSANTIFFEGLEAFPLRIITEMPMGLGKMTMEAGEVAPGSVDSKVFELPSDYAVEKFDAQKFGQQMLGNY